MASIAGFGRRASTPTHGAAEAKENTQHWHTLSAGVRQLDLAPYQESNLHANARRHHVEPGHRGHEVVVTDAWSHGKVMGIRHEKERGVILGAACPKGNIGNAIGW